MQAQQDLAGLETWEPVGREPVFTKMDARRARDAFLRALRAGIRARAEAKMREGGVDVDGLRRRLGRPEPDA